MFLSIIILNLDVLTTEESAFLQNGTTCSDLMRPINTICNSNLEKRRLFSSIRNKQFCHF